MYEQLHAAIFTPLQIGLLRLFICVKGGRPLGQAGRPAGRRGAGGGLELWSIPRTEPKQSQMFEILQNCFVLCTWKKKGGEEKYVTLVCVVEKQDLWGWSSGVALFCRIIDGPWAEVFIQMKIDASFAS